MRTSVHIDHPTSSSYGRGQQDPKTCRNLKSPPPYGMGLIKISPHCFKQGIWGEFGRLWICPENVDSKSTFLFRFSNNLNSMLYVYKSETSNRERSITHTYLTLIVQDIGACPKVISCDINDSPWQWLGVSQETTCFMGDTWSFT